ncbi:TIGR02234 family membrane protein [Corynebacterium uterequi]|uniref:Trp region conserved putative membrane protein n=1 Tax=Corynebacterium uterequi TaxID=1072256 RepID=A0A0G3HHJ8_9CORY|nr:TIGR02234 family membrane protein [Corynebacterium uterequi]AKK11413.1 trp region conserved putative membrane protein [Corynebacterium uterequi]
MASKDSRRLAHLAAAVLGGAAVLGWLGSRLTWLTVNVTDDLSGARSIELPGAAWATEVPALALVLMAAAVAGVALRRRGRQVVGVIAAVAAAFMALPGTLVLAGQADPERAHRLLVAGAASARASHPVHVAQWASVEAIDPAVAGPAVTLCGAALAIVAGVVLAMRPGADPSQDRKYARSSQRRDHLAADLAEAPDSGRVLWDALDDDIDPTEAGGPFPRGH